jgi:low affinity Fe/Cu permease
MASILAFIKKNDVGTVFDDRATKAIHPTRCRPDSLALHAKLDELLRVDHQARTELTRLDEQEPEAIEQHRDAEARSIDGSG